MRSAFFGVADGLYLGGLGPQRQSGDKARKRVLGQPGYLVDISISGSQFTRNTAARSTYGPGQTLGGAIAIAPKYETLGGGEHQVTLSGSQLIENAVTTAVPLRPADNTTDSKLAPGPIAYSFGGGLAVLHSGSGAENRPDGQGAREQLGVPLPTTINVDIDGSTFDNNLAPAGGGAAVFASTITVDGSDFTGNGAYFAGGGIFSGTRPKYGPPNPVATDATSLSFGETSFDGNLAAAFAGVVGFAGSVSGDGLDLLNNQTAQHPGFDPLRPASAKAGAWFANQTSPGKGTPVACSLGGGSGKYGIGGGGVLASTSSTSLSGGSQVSGNCAAYAAGGVVLVGGKYGGIDGTVTVAADSVVSNNQASISAPGMVVSAGPSSKYGGSGGAASGSSASISGSFTGNTASLSAYGTGGGLALALKYGASASVSQASISGNQAAQGGGVSAAAYSGPSATVTLTSNLVVSDSTISGNNAVVGGGVNLAGVVASSGTPGLGNSELRLSGIADKLQRMGVRTPRLDSVIERRFGNTAKSTKGAVQPLVALLQNVTVDSNTTNPAGGTATISEQGGGLLANNVDLTMDHVTITGNSTGGQGGGVQLAGPAATTIDNSIIALNSDDGSAPDLGGSADINFSLVQDVTGATLNGANNLTGVDPMLDPLADNGGPTLTRLPQIGSPVVNAGDPAFNIGLLPNDQRGAGFPRDAGGGTDMGAVEGITPREVISIDIAPNPFAEGTSATMTVTLDGNTQVDTLVTVDFSGTAALGTDFGSGDADGGTAGIQVQVLAGSSSGSVQLDATADSLHEGDEPFTATVSAADFATIPLTPPSFAATITDGDALTFSIADASGAENIGNLDFTVSLNVPSTQAVSVTAMTANGTALAGADYTAVSTTVNFPAGSTSQAVSVPIIDDAVAESAETFAVNLSNPSTGSIADANATGTIIDDESAPTVSLSLTPPSNTEGGGSFMVTANLSGPSGEDVVVTLNFGGTASFGTDYTVTDQDPGTPGIQIIIPAGSTSASVTVSPLVDNENEPDETIIVSIGSASGAGAAGAPGTGTIVNGTAGPLPAAPPELIPTLNEWMLMLLGLLLPAAVMVKLRGGRRDDKLKA
ncbi:MAG: Calx-beta domain-containing protein [Lysobacteraceae bacterium]